MSARTDTDRLNALAAYGNGIALIHDDDERWAVVSEGFQNVRETNDQPLFTQYYVDPNSFRQEIRDAIDLWLDSQDEILPEDQQEEAPDAQEIPDAPQATPAPQVLGATNDETPDDEDDEALPDVT